MTIQAGLSPALTWLCDKAAWVDLANQHDQHDFFSNCTIEVKGKQSLLSHCWSYPYSMSGA